MTISILDQARQEGREQARQQQAQINFMTREDEHYKGYCEGLQEGDRFHKRWNLFWFVAGMATMAAIHPIIDNLKAAIQ